MAMRALQAWLFFAAHTEAAVASFEQNTGEIASNSDESGWFGLQIPL